MKLLCHLLLAVTLQLTALSTTYGDQAPTSPRLPMAVNISVFYSDVTQEAHVSCAYISSPPIYPTIRVSQTSRTVQTLNATPSLMVQDCYNELTMVNVLTIVLHNPRLYVGTVFECYFLLHGGVQVSSGPARVTLTPTEGLSPPLCSEEKTPPTSPRLLMEVNISVFYSDVTQEAQVSCAYISSPPIYPTIRVNQTSHTVLTLNATPSLNVQDCYNELTMVNVLTIVLHNPRLYMGTVFECYFLLHGGVQVSSGPARVTLTPTEGLRPPLCSEEETPSAKVDTAEISIVGSPVVSEGAEVTIQCSYMGEGISNQTKPNFRINGANHSSGSLRDSLPHYNHHYHMVDVGKAYYNLTLVKAETANNGTTFQCFFKDGATASNTVTLIVTGLPLNETVTIAIENSTTVQVGDVVDIRCQYSGERIAFKLPSFIINRKTIRVESGGAIKSELSDYQHKHSIALEKGKWVANYRITLKSARISDNNTVYQCFCELTEGSRVTRVWSEPVILTVIGPPEPATTVTVSSSTTDIAFPQPTPAGVPLERSRSEESGGPPEPATTVTVSSSTTDITFPQPTLAGVPLERPRSKGSGGPPEPATTVTVSSSPTDITFPQSTPAGVPLERSRSEESGVSLWIVIMVSLVCIVVVAVSCVIVAFSIGIAIKATRGKGDEYSMTPCESISGDQPQPRDRYQVEAESRSTTDATILTFRDGDHQRRVGTAGAGVSEGETFTFSPAQEEADNDRV